MAFSHTFFIGLLFASALLAPLLAAFAWRRRSAPGALSLAGLILAAGLWDLGYALGLEAPDLAAKLAWAKFQYLGIASLPALFLVFAVQHTGRQRWLTPGRLAALAVVPALTLLLALTNEAHGLIWREWALESTDGLRRLKLEYGAWFWLAVVFNYGALLAGSALLVQNLAGAAEPSRRQAALLLFGTLSPWIANLLFLAGFNPLRPYDPTPLAFTLSGAALIVGALRFRLLELAPIAHEAVVAGMNDGLLVLDAGHHLVDINPAAGRILGLEAERHLGRPVAALLGGVHGWPAALQPGTEATGEVRLGAGPGERIYEARLSPLAGSGARLTGHIVTLHDITQRRRAEKRLETQSTVTALLAEAESLEACAPAALEAVCRNLGWKFGELWTLEPNGASLVCSQICQTVGPDLEMFIAQTRRLTLSRGEGLPGRVWASGQPEWSGNLETDPAFIRAAAAAQAGLRSGLAVPLRFGAVVLGVMAFFGPETQPPEPELLETFRAIGSQVGQFIVRKEAEAALQAVQVKQQAVLDAIPDLVLRLSRDGTVLDRFAAKDESWAGAGQAWRAGNLREVLPPDAAAEFLALIERVLSTDDIGFFESRLAVALEGGPPVPRDYEARLVASGLDETVALVRDISERKQAEEALARYADEMATLYRVSQEIGTRLDLEAVYSSARRAARRLMPGEVFIISLLEESQRDINFAYFMDGDQRVPPQRFPAGQGLSGRVIATGESLRVDDLVQAPQLKDLHLGRRRQARAILAVPLQVGERVFGMMSIQHDEPFAYSLAHEQLFSTLAVHVASAIENARLYDAARRQSRHLGLLNDITRTAIEQPDLTTMLQLLANRLGELLEADGCYLTLWDEAQQLALPGAAYGTLRSVYTQLRTAPGEPTLTAAALDAGRAVAVEDVFTSPHVNPRIAAQLPARSLLGLPLVAGSQKLGGALIAFSRLHHFTDDEIARAEQAARQIALGIAKAQLYQAIADERGRLEALIKSSRDGIVLIGMDRRVLVLNNAAVQMLDLPDTPEIWLGRPLARALGILRRRAPEAARATLAEIRRIQHGDEPAAEGEYDIPPRRIHWFNLPVMAGAASLGRLLMLRDVTQEHLLEKMRDDLTHTMVHDLRNPASGIRLALEMLTTSGHGELGPEQLDLISIARESAQRMLDLVNAILDVSRLESGQMPLEQRRLNLDNLIQRAFQSQMPLAQAKSLTLSADLPAGLPEAWADDSLVSRVLQNLVGNAIKFTPPGGAIRLVARPDPADPSVVRLSVCDSGPGIPPEITGRLFQKFVTGRVRDRGSGLGLAFCRLAVEAHGGRIWVESEPGRGACFHFTLPQAQ